MEANKKTTKEWLKEVLPETLYLMAIENSTEQVLSATAENFSIALSGAFAWQKTEQGFVFWRKVCKQYE